MAALFQILMGVIGSLGFAVLFGIYDKKLLWIALGSATGWFLYILCRSYGCNDFSAMFATSFFASGLSELLARICKAPVSVFLFPVLIPEIPGAQLYYAMYYLLQGDNIQFLARGQRVLVEAGAIVLGIFFAAYIAKFLLHLLWFYRKRRS